MLTRSRLLADSICRLRPAFAESRFSEQASRPDERRGVTGLVTHADRERINLPLAVQVF